MATETQNKASWIRIILGGLLVSILALLHFNFLFQGQYIGVGFLIVFALSVFLSKKKETKTIVKHFQYKTASILSFLLPVSALVYTFVFTGSAVTSETSEAAQAGAAIGGAIGGGIVTFFTFIIGLSLGIVFYIMSRTKKA